MAKLGSPPLDFPPAGVLCGRTMAVDRNAHPNGRSGTVPHGARRPSRVGNPPRMEVRKHGRFRCPWPARAPTR
jgi:hypothetical protein